MDESEADEPVDVVRGSVHEAVEDFPRREEVAAREKNRAESPRGLEVRGAPDEIFPKRGDGGLGIAGGFERDGQLPGGGAVLGTRREAFSETFDSVAEVAGRAAAPAEIKEHGGAFGIARADFRQRRAVGCGGVRGSPRRSCAAPSVWCACQGASARAVALAALCAAPACATGASTSKGKQKHSARDLRGVADFELRPREARPKGGGGGRELARRAGLGEREAPTERRRRAYAARVRRFGVVTQKDAQKITRGIRPSKSPRPRSASPSSRSARTALRRKLRRPSRPASRRAAHHQARARQLRPPAEQSRLSGVGPDGRVRAGSGTRPRG